MKSFKTYLMESQRTYKYCIKIAGDVDDKMLQLLELNLQKFGPMKMDDPKTTPIQKKLSDFDDIVNDRITKIHVEFKYPVIEPFVKQLARLIGLDENRLVMQQADYVDSINDESERLMNQVNHSPLLNHGELEDSGKQANKDYADQYLTKISKEMEKDKIEMRFAGEKTKPAEDYRKIPGNTKSPMTSINRAPMPSTGARK